MKTDAYKPQHLKPKKRRLLTTGSLLCYLLIAVVMSTGASFSKYTTSVSGSDSARVARFEVSTSAADGQDMNLAEGADTASDEYVFTVSSDSEVAVEYDVVVTLPDDLPAGVTMKLDGYEADNIYNHVYTFSNTGYTFDPDPSNSNNHTLTVTATDFSADVTLSEITIDVVASQID